MTHEARMRLLVGLLRLAGTITVSAFLTILLPVEWMASTHRWLGLGEFPRAPVVPAPSTQVVTASVPGKSSRG